MNSFGVNFRINIFGESHGKSIGVTIDGTPPGIALSEQDFDKDISRRKTGSKGTSSRLENDKPIILSGIFNGKTTGAPITIIFENNNTKSKDYSQFVEHPRPGHADFVANIKYNNYQDYRGGGHFSGRITLPLVAAGVVAKKIVDKININAKVLSLAGNIDIEQTLNIAIKENNSIGGIVECEAKNIPIGFGEPFFNSVESLISHAVFSIPGVKGIEFGSGFESANHIGIDNNDIIIDTSGKTETNNAGGINGGITNGNNLIFRIAIKPTSSIYKPQKTLNIKTKKIETLQISGRHDICFAMRTPVIVEAITAIVLADFLITK